MPASRRIRTAYITSRYPSTSHTFVQREIEAIRREGVEVEPWTVRRNPREDMRTEAMRVEDDNTRAILGDGKDKDVLKAALRFMRRHPKAFGGALGRALRSGYPSPKARLWQLFYLAEALYMHQELEERGIRHIHAHHINVAADVARMVVDLGNRVDGEGEWSWSFTIHGPTEFDNVAEHDMAAKAADADAISAISYFAQSQIWRQMDPEEWGKVSIQRMTVDPQKFTAPPSREHDGPIRLISIGRLAGQKGFPLLIEMTRILRDRGVDFDLRIVGGGELEQSLAEQISDYGLEDAVTLVGPLGEDDVVRELQWADIFVSSSFAEGLPVVLMEAMSAELATVATRIAAIEELIDDGVNGRVVPPANAVALADAVQELAGDPELRREMGRRGRESVLEKFTQDKVGPQMARFFRDMLAS